MPASDRQNWPAAAGAFAPNVVATVQRLRLEGATAEFVRALARAGMPSILLKGVSIAHWLYEPGWARECGDSDILVPPNAVATAQGILDNLGFKAYIDERSMPEWWVEHAQGWLRREDGAVIDLHRTLLGVGVDPETLWNTLSANVELIEVGGVGMQTLTIPGRAFHLALHATQHPRWSVKSEELRRAIAITDDGVWTTAAEIAATLDATGAFATGLRMLPEGCELAERLELPRGASMDVTLRVRSAPAVALGFEQLAQADGFKSRVTILRHKLAPPPTFMRAWSPRLARRGQFGLALAYLWRPLWILGRAPGGLAAWLGARRSGGG